MEHLGLKATFLSNWLFFFPYRQRNFSEKVAYALDDVSIFDGEIQEQIYW